MHWVQNELFLGGGDELVLLEKSISLLAEEVLTAQDAMRLRHEIQQKAKLLDVLKAVTRKLGVGVMFLDDDGTTRILNPQMAAFKAEYGEECFSIDQLSQQEEVQLRDRQHRQHILWVRGLALSGVGRVMLVQDVTEQRRTEK